MISQGSCDTENGSKKKISFTLAGIHYILKRIKIENTF